MSSLKFIDFSPEPSDAHKSWVLVYFVGSLGDTIVCIPALEAIRRQFPDDKIILLHDYQTVVPISPLDLVPKTLIDGGLSYVMHRQLLPKLREFADLRREIRRHKIKAAVYLVVTERFGWRVWRDKLFFQLCGIKNLIGFYPVSKKRIYHRDKFGVPLPTPSEAVLKLERLERDGINTQNLNLSQHLLNFSEREKIKVKDWLDANRQNPQARLIAICPGSKLAANNWGIENFIELGKRLLADQKTEILIIGGKPEMPLAAQMIAAWNGRGIDATGKFAVNESGALFAHCELMFGNDTGTTHLAAAAGIPCVAVYHFRDNPGHWFPLGSGHLIIQHAPRCAGCHLFECATPGHPCMSEIKVETVWQLLTEFMAKDKTTETVSSERVLV